MSQKCHASQNSFRPHNYIATIQNDSIKSVLVYSELITVSVGLTIALCGVRWKIDKRKTLYFLLLNDRFVHEIPPKLVKQRSRNRMHTKIYRNRFLSGSFTEKKKWKIRFALHSSFVMYSMACCAPCLCVASVQFFRFQKKNCACRLNGKTYASRSSSGSGSNSNSMRTVKRIATSLYDRLSAHMCNFHCSFSLKAIRLPQLRVFGVSIRLCETYTTAHNHDDP